MTPIAAGRRLGPYEIVSRIGGGGMGEVFRARDTRLDRTVAIKILPVEFAENTELRTRFELEARTISQISHPHICALHDVGRAEGVEYLVLEFIEGETLTDRIARGPLPIEDVLRFGSQIAAALACAHRARIVHRDLKPGNVMITKAGAKLLDFGIARSAPAAVAASGDDATRHAPLTQAGTILGTVQYMSPEQIAGEDVDERSDIFALGAVLYEMLTGQRAFDGTSRTSVVTAVLSGSPRSAASLRPTTPPSLEHVIAKCLARDREERWQSAADIASELMWIGGTSTGEQSAVGGKKGKRGIASLITLGIAALLVVGAAIGGSYFSGRDRPVEPPVRSELLIDEPLTPALFGSIALSPDGNQLLILVGPSGNPSIAIRSLTTGETKKLAGTEGAIFPFWAPDSQRIAFFAGGKLKTIGASGGSVQTLCDARQGRGGSWAPNGVIVFVPDLASPVYKVNENGGAPVQVTTSGTPPESHRHPVFLPDGRRFLFSSRTGGVDVLFAGSIDAGPQTRILENASRAAFARGRLFFVRDGNLVSQPFDPAKLELSGTLTPVASRVEYFKVRAIGNFSVTETKMVFVTEASGLNTIVAQDAKGQLNEIPASVMESRILDISPDDRTLAVAIYEHFEEGDVWMVPLDGGTKSRLTFVHTGALSGAFSPDGKRFAMSSGFYGQSVAVEIRSLVSNLTEKVYDSPLNACIVTGWSRDGKYLVVDTQSSKTGFDVQSLDVAKRTMTPVVQGPADEVAPALSPNGKWLAYVSMESGAPEIYLTGFPEGAGKWQATPDGGNAPRWSRDGKQLVYAKGDRLMSIDFREGPLPQFGSPVTLPVKITPDRIFLSSYSGYALTSDGRFITTQPVGHGQPTIHLVANWNEIIGR
jgi:serine/threonine protein kinase